MEDDFFRIVIPFSPNALASGNEANMKPIDADHDANRDAKGANRGANGVFRVLLHNNHCK